MNFTQIAGTGMFALGVALLWLAYGELASPLDDLTVALTGQHPDRTTWYWITGVVAAATGGVMALFGRSA